MEIQGKICIPWGNDSNDYLTLNFTKEGIVHVKSTPNTVIPEGGSAPISRIKILRFRGAEPTSTEAAQGFIAEAVLRVLQQPDDQIVATFEDTYSIYPTSDTIDSEGNPSTKVAYVVN